MTDDEPYFARTVTARSLEEILMAAARISPPAAPGSLLKSPPRRAAPRTATHHSAPRLAATQRNTTYLKMVRRLPCLACDHDQGCEAAHVRMSFPGKANALGQKPGDEWVLPLCAVCHRRQHAIGEPEFWRDLGLDPIAIALELFELGHVEPMRSIIFACREQRK